MDQLALIVPGMWADHHVITVLGLLRDTEGVEVTGASAMDATLRLEYDPAKTDPQRIAAQLEQAGYPTGEASRGRSAADRQAGVADGWSARHGDGSGRPDHVGRSPQVLTFLSACVHPPVHDPTGPPGRRHVAARSHPGVKESPHG